VLLADGNIGIGGAHPAGCCAALPHDLLARTGGARRVPPPEPARGPGSRTCTAPEARPGRRFVGRRWRSTTSAVVAAGAGLRTAEIWTEAGRWFASLAHA
jgi:hypothetical protein